jgi:hypothetical protein
MIVYNYFMDSRINGLNFLRPPVNLNKNNLLFYNENYIFK